MAHSDPEAIRRFTRSATIVFVCLLALTVITVAVSYLNLGHTGTIVVALAIATLKAGLVAAFFMHLISEKQLIYAVLIVSAVFFAVLVFIPLFHYFARITN